MGSVISEVPESQWANHVESFSVAKKKGEPTRRSPEETIQLMTEQLIEGGMAPKDAHTAACAASARVEHRRKNPNDLAFLINPKTRR